MVVGFHVRDFVETHDGLVFAVVINGIDDDGVYGFLRYVSENGVYRKVVTGEATKLLESSYPDYLFYSERWDTHLHKVSIEKIRKHYRPVDRLRTLLVSEPSDAIEARLIDLLHLFDEQGVDMKMVGVTGSLLLGVQSDKSDIDLVVYHRAQFHQLRSIIKNLVEQRKLHPLDDELWRETYSRRGCSLNVDEYIWHERQKFNKAVIGGTKFDMSLVNRDMDTCSYRKLGKRVFMATVVDDQYAFDYPARYLLNNAEISEVVSFTHTYVGQARQGELIEAAGWLEVSGEGTRRLVIGSSREAEGEYIKVAGKN